MAQYLLASRLFSFPGRQGIPSASQLSSRPWPLLYSMTLALGCFADSADSPRLPSLQAAISVPKLASFLACRRRCCPDRHHLPAPDGAVPLLCRKIVQPFERTAHPAALAPALSGRSLLVSRVRL